MIVWVLGAAGRYSRQNRDERTERENLKAGDTAKLLFEIETREGRRVIDRGGQPPRDYVVEKYGPKFFGL